MITISYFRFEIQQDSLEHVFLAPNKPLDKVRYISKKDHEQTLADSNCDLNRACLVAHKFLKNHYGYVVIRQSNQDEYSNAVKPIKICNHRKFYFDMLSHDLLVVKS